MNQNEFNPHFFTWEKRPVTLRDVGPRLVKAMAFDLQPCTF